jgi:hypothetical protein
MSFIYDFVNDLVVIVMDGYFVLLKRIENACDELLFFSFPVKKLTNFLIMLPMDICINPRIHQNLWITR